MKLPNKFRPMDISKKYRLKFFVETGKNQNFNWRTYVRWYPVGWRINKQTLFRAFSRLHYLGCHAPKPIQQKYRRVYNLFEEKYFGTKGKASKRYQDKYTANKWL